jgi:hypothetical protein
MVKDNKKAFIRVQKPNIKPMAAKNSANTTNINDSSEPIPKGSENLKLLSNNLKNLL